MSVGDRAEPAHSTKTATGTSSEILALNGRRRYASITNLGAVVVFVSLGATAEVNKGWALDPNGGRMVLEYDESTDVWIGGQINGITAGGSAVLSCAEVSA